MFRQMMQNGEFDAIIDVRTQAEWETGHIPNATLVENLALAAGTDGEITSPATTDYLVGCTHCDLAVYCQTGVRAAQAIVVLQEAGFVGRLYNGLGVSQWTAAGYPVVTSASLDPPCTTSVTEDVCLVPSPSPIGVLIDIPSDRPSDVPSDMPSDAPSDSPSDVPSDEPSDIPSDEPTSSTDFEFMIDIPDLVVEVRAGVVGSDSPSDSPSDTPSDSPSDVPSDMPSIGPTEQQFGSFEFDIEIPDLVFPTTTTVAPNSTAPSSVPSSSGLPTI